MGILEVKDNKKSYERVKEVGEVYTPISIVDEMLDLKGIKEHSECIDATFLEPSCGNGNFLIRILGRKLETAKILADTQERFDLYAARCLCSVYGIDILPDNVFETRDRLYAVLEDTYNNLGYAMSNTMGEVFRYILNRNIILGDALECKMAKIRSRVRKGLNTIRFEFTEDLIVNSWVFNGDNIKRKSYRLSHPEYEMGINYREVKYTELHRLMDQEEEEYML